MTEQQHDTRGSWPVLAPAAVGLLPAILLGYLLADRNELHDWTQHLVAGLAFGTVFVVTFLFGGRWRRRAAVTAGVSVFAVVAWVIWRDGLPGFQMIFALAGTMVGGGYWFSQRREPMIAREAIWVAAGSTLGFWALAQLSWWEPFSRTLVAWSNRLWFLGITAAITGWLCAWHEAKTTGRPGRTFRLLDIAVLALLAAALARTTDLADNIVAAHHWSVYVAPAEMIREGHALLGEVPSQYGFLNIVLLAWLPVANRFEALYWMQVATLWLSGAIIYFVLRAWLVAWWWQIGAGLIAVICVAFFCGDLSQLSGPMFTPVPVRSGSSGCICCWAISFGGIMR